MKRTTPINLILLLAIAITSLTFASCGTEERTYGYIGIRPLPRNSGEESRYPKGIGTYDNELKPNSFAALHTDVIFDYTGNFATNKKFFEHYLPYDRPWIDPNPETNPLIRKIINCEKSGGELEHILICREGELYGHGYWGPIKEDSRILFPRDVKDYRKLFKDAYDMKLVKHPDYKLIQLVAHANAFLKNPDARETVKMMDGIVYECHQFNKHWPYETGWTRPEELIEGANWTLDQGLEYIFYYGPIIYKNSPGWYENAERDWLLKFWDEGLPKHHPRMHYYLNVFPHAHGADRKVGPESDPESYLGFLDWLIKEIKGEDPKF